MVAAEEVVLVEPVPDPLPVAGVVVCVDVVDGAVVVVVGRVVVVGVVVVGVVVVGVVVVGVVVVVVVVAAVEVVVFELLVVYDTNSFDDELPVRLALVVLELEVLDEAPSSAAVS
jgi:hypothetical protein